MHKIFHVLLCGFVCFLLFVALADLYHFLWILVALCVVLVRFLQCQQKSLHVDKLTNISL